MIVRLSHPWRWHHIRDILDTDRDPITEIEARALIRGGIARNVDDILEDVGGGWFAVPRPDGTTDKVRGHKTAVRMLRRDAR